MKATCVVMIAALALMLAGCFGDDEQEAASMLGGLA